jgi:hypothetical protein
MIDDLKMFARYFAGLPRYLNSTLSFQDARGAVERQLQARADSFLRVVRRGIYDRPGNPYLRLLQNARIDHGWIEQSVQASGVEATLESLYSSGVYVSFEEFKGRAPVTRPGLQFRTRPSDFDNPLLARDYELRSGGSRGAGTRIIVDFDLLTHEAAYNSLSAVNLGVSNRPVAIWYSVPPTVSGMKHVLRNAKTGHPVQRWFAQNRLQLHPRNLKFYVFTHYAIRASRFTRSPLPAPEYTPIHEASRVAEWLAARVSEGMPAEIHTRPSSGVRVCMAARERGLDIAGTFFRFNSEPYTAAKAAVIEAAGAKAAVQYSLAEIGNIGLACARPSALDDVHVATDKLAVIQHEKSLPKAGTSVPALYYTTLLTCCPKLMLNVESDDYGILETRRCGCLLGDLGFHVHLSGIRSYDKLTSEGMTFLGSELISLVDEQLPSRFGGHPTDYQFVEEEDGALPRISLVISPRVGRVDEAQVVDAVMSVLRSYSWCKKVMADIWRESDTLRVVRREPYQTAAAKILPLHLVPGRARRVDASRP